MRFSVLVSLLLYGCGSAALPPAGEKRAAALAQVWARHVGAAGRELDAAGDMKLGETGLMYDRGTDTLHGRVWVNMALIKGEPSHVLQPQRRLVAALNDPAIGRMYDQGGGHFVLDELREGYFLERAFPVPQTTPKILIRDMERMRKVAPTWTVKWFFEVAMIMHGNQTKPTRRMVLDD